MWRGEFSKESEGVRKTDRQLEAELEKKILFKKSMGGIWGKGEGERSSRLIEINAHTRGSVFQARGGRRSKRGSPFLE